MKKLIVSLFFACMTIGYAYAENTDVSTIDNVVYITPCTVFPGTQTTLSIQMKNTAEIRSFQFDLYLPDGVSVVKSAKGKIQGALNPDRLPEEDEHTLTFSEQPDGAIRFLSGSEFAETFTGTDGVIATLKINVAADVVAGDYPVYIRNIVLSENDIANHYDTELVESTITVGGPAETRIVFDETSTSLPTLPTPATNVDVRVKRTIKANEWSTICLPFAMSEGQVQAAFGGDVQLADFTGTDPVFDDKDVAGINVNFSSVVAIEANHPYIIKVSSPVTEFTADGVDIIADEENACVEFDNGKTGSRRVVYSGFYGTYHAETVLDEFTLFLNDNKFWYSAGGTRMKAFRAFFDFLDILTSVKEGGEAKIRFQFENSNATAIQTIAANAEDNVIYSINGVRMGTADKLKALPKGLYIVNGKKVIIK